MGLSNVRAEVIKKLQGGKIQHETTRSGNIDEKNLLLIGKVSVEEVVDLINATKGTEYKVSLHHFDKAITLHVFKPKRNGVKWYIKCYLIEPDVWFISVHH